jgi:hypothetical protein
VNVVNFGGSAGTFASGIPAVNATQISGDSTAADNLETAYDDTAGAVPWAGIVDQGTAQSVGATSIVLRAAAAFVDDALIGCTVVITNGTQLGSRSVITDYVGATDTATLSNGWTGATPSGTPTYKIFASAAGSGVAQTGDAYAVVASGTFGNAAIKTAVDAIGGGGVADWTADERTALRSILGIPASGTTPDDPTTGILDTIRDRALAIEVDTQDLQGRTPAALVSGRIDASVGAMAANVMTAAAAAADLTTELQSGLATAAALTTLSGLVDTLEASAAAIEADTQDIQSRIPATLVGGRLDCTIDATGMESGAIDAILDDTIGDGTITVRQALRVVLAGMAGKLSGAATTTITLRNVADTANVVVATVDSDGNRSATTVTP